jgi:hypothetical protein
MKKLKDINYLAVGEDGKYSNQGTYRSTPEQVSEIVDEIVRSNIQVLDLYFHGGLVSEQSGQDSACRIIQALNPQHTKHPETHQIAFIWKTDLVTTLRENLDDVFSAGLGRKLLAWTERALSKELPSVKTKSSSSSAGLTIDEIYEEWSSSELTGKPPFFDIAKKDSNDPYKGIKSPSSTNPDRIARSIQREISSDISRNAGSKEEWLTLPKRIRLTPESKALIGDIENKKGFFSALGVAKLVASITISVISRLRSERDHGFHATVVEEILREVFLANLGQWVWSGMKDKAAAMWTEEGCVGNDLLSQLSDRKPDLSINLIGHSAGSICAANAADLITQKSLPLTLKKVALLAPACTAQTFKTSFLEREAEIEALRMFTMADKFELEDALVEKYPWLYPSSLLYFISGVLEDFSDYPILGMERFLSGKPPYSDEELLSITEYLSEPGRLVLSKTSDDSPKGFRSHSVDHGFFNEDPATLDSLYHFIR